MVYVILYLVSIVIANVTVALFGPSMVVINAFLFIGLDLTARDKLHDRWHNKHLKIKMLSLILTGSLLSWVVNSSAGRVALASFLSFLIAGIIDTAVYHILFKRSKLQRINGSNVVSSLADSILFPTIAFGVFMPIIVLGQFTAKVLGGFIWSLIFSLFEKDGLVRNLLLRYGKK